MIHLFIFILLLVPRMSLAAIDSSEEIHRLWTGIGALTQNTGRYSSAPTGAASHFNSLYPLLVVTGRLGSSSWAFSPSVSYTPLSRKNADSGTTSNILNLGGRAVKTFGSFELLLGLGNSIYWVGGSGGTVALNNGTGTTTFGFAPRRVLTTQFYLDFGMAYLIGSMFRVDADINMLDAFSSSRRAVNAVMSFSVGFF